MLRNLQIRLFSSTTLRQLKADNLKITKSTAIQTKPDEDSLVFGHNFSDHMLTVEWNDKEGWGAPNIKPFQNLTIHPAAKVLHYSIECFEGLKAFRGDDGKIRLFRPEKNMQRLLVTADRICLPHFDTDELLKCMTKLVEIDADCVPRKPGGSLYIRPTFIGTGPTLKVESGDRALLYIFTCPVGPYFKFGIKPIKLLADPKYVRAWPGGVGHRKVGGNYGPTIKIQQIAESLGCQQVLWLYGPERHLTELGTMNVFVYLVNEKGERELITPPLEDEIILPGITRDSLLQIARNWNEFKVSERRISMKEFLDAHRENRLLECFGAGTACVVLPVSSILYEGKDIEIPIKSDSLSKRLLEALQDVQYGRVEFKDFTKVVC